MNACAGMGGDAREDVGQQACRSSRSSLRFMPRSLMPKGAGDDQLLRRAGTVLHDAGPRSIRYSSGGQSASRKASRRSLGRKRCAWRPRTELASAASLSARWDAGRSASLDGFMPEPQRDHGAGCATEAVVLRAALSALERVTECRCLSTPAAACSARTEDATLSPDRGCGKRLHPGPMRPPARPAYAPIASCHRAARHHGGHERHDGGRHDARDDQVCGVSEDPGGAAEATFLRTAS